MVLYFRFISNTYRNENRGGDFVFGEENFTSSKIISISYTQIFSSTNLVFNNHIDICLTRDILLRGGNAVDAAIAILFCVGVVNPQNSGIGGGSFMTITYKKSDGPYIDCINGRESAPLAATENMFGKNPSLASEGPLSIAVPGELAASYAAWKAYGKLEWKDLVMPAATLAMNGVRVTKALAAILQTYKKSVMANPSLR